MLYEIITDCRIANKDYHKGDIVSCEEVEYFPSVMKPITNKSIAEAPKVETPKVEEPEEEEAIEEATEEATEEVAEEVEEEEEAPKEVKPAKKGWSKKK